MRQDVLPDGRDGGEVTGEDCGDGKAEEDANDCSQGQLELQGCGLICSVLGIEDHEEKSHALDGQLSCRFDKSLGVCIRPCCQNEERKKNSHWKSIF